MTDSGNEGPGTLPQRRCAIYARTSVSSTSNRGHASVHAQRNECLRLIRSSEGWQALPLAYLDVGFSGDDLDRPALERLLTDIDAGEVDVVVVWDRDRLARRLRDYRSLVKRFLDAKVMLVIAKPAYPRAEASARRNRRLRSEE